MTEHLCPRGARLPSATHLCISLLRGCCCLLPRLLSLLLQGMQVPLQLCCLGCCSIAAPLSCRVGLLLILQLSQHLSCCL